LIVVNPRACTFKSRQRIFFPRREQIVNGPSVTGL
jgi:hypothetical protein